MAVRRVASHQGERWRQQPGHELSFISIYGNAICEELASIGAGIAQFPYDRSRAIGGTQAISVMVCKRMAAIADHCVRRYPRQTPELASARQKQGPRILPALVHDLAATSARSYRCRACGARGPAGLLGRMVIEECPGWSSLPAGDGRNKRNQAAANAASSASSCRGGPAATARETRRRVGVHESHSVAEVVGGILFCRTCGGLARERIVGLGRPCPGGPTSAANASAIKRVAAGKAPRPQYGEEREQEIRAETRRLEGASSLLLAIRQRAAGKRSRAAESHDGGSAPMMARRA